MSPAFVGRVCLSLAPAVAVAQLPILDGNGTAPAAPGWAGFGDIPFIVSSLGSLLLATALAALVAFHPAALRTVDTLEEAQLPKIYIAYAVVGAVIGTTVLKFGIGVGVVIFGIGGLIRFRTDTGSTRDTGRLILVTLVGLVAGLGLPHFAVLTALFTFGLISLLDARPICRLVVKELPRDQLGEAAEAYRRVLRAEGCAILSERRSMHKEQVAFILRAKRTATPESLTGVLGTDVPGTLRGTLEWDIE